MQITMDFANFAELPAILPQSTVAGSPAGLTLTEAVLGIDRADSAKRDELSELVDNAQHGVPGAIDELLVQIRPRAMAVALRVLRNRDNAEDAVQDALAKIWRSLPRFEGRSSFATWIHRIVMNASLDLLRRNSCRPESAISASERDEQNVPRREPSHEETPEHTMSQAEVQLMVRNAVAALAPTHRQAVTLREFEDLSYEEIAAEAACPIGTVMSRLHHARKKLAEDLRGFADCRQRYAA